MDPVYTPFPFQLPDRCITSLPEPRADGLIYFDFRIAHQWDGVLVAKPGGECIGYYAGRKLRREPVLIEPGKIESVRPPTLWHRMLTQLPLHWYDPHSASMALAFIACPVLLVVSYVWQPALLYAVLGAGVTAFVLMCSVSGFVLMKLPTQTVALASVLWASIGLLRQVL